MYVEVRFYTLDGQEVLWMRLPEFPADTVVHLAAEWLKFIEGKTPSWHSRLWKARGVQKMIIFMETLEYANGVETGLIQENGGR